ncbi:ubiquitin carboxyl-terminal hydrolase 19-like [Impatiens glandulifera]|uniref:ubiquitin carboxyl-terminal hydrolase 19-like n=1 Tax=Impatiens glandulifera TaxID=253017 RepID=UPI001FB0CA11|nr:ubiquitin carboxyl-terminal hydrolase 19-like [Impatiens glandulifera]
MLVGRDLGFSYLVLIFSFIGPVFFFLVRRRWRRSVARKEEIKRLLILAAEEAARVEVEATADYYTNSVPLFIPLPVHYQCVVCFSPTKTRCARCKAVRYCSSKCQIIHWRQGHKEECHPFTIHDDTDEAFDAVEKTSKHLEYESGGNNCETKSTQHANSDLHYPEDPSSHLDLSSECSSLSSESEDECITPEEGTNSKHDSKIDNSDKAKRNCVADVEKIKLSLSERTSVSDAVNHLNSPLKENQHNSKIINQTSQNTSSKSVSSFVSDFSKSPLHDPPISSADFWEGTSKTSRARLDAHEDSAQNKSSADVNSGIDDVHAHEDSAQVTSLRDGNCGIDAHENSSQIRSSRDENRFIDDKRSPQNSPFNLQRNVASTTRKDISNASTPRIVASTTRKDISNASTPRIVVTNKSMDKTILPEVEQRKSSTNHQCASKSGREQLFTKGENQLLNPLVSKSGGSENIFVRDAPLSSSNKINSVQGAKPMKLDTSTSVAANSSHFKDHSPNVKNGLRASVLKVVEQASKSSKHYLSGIRNEIAGRHDNKALFPYDQFVKLYNWKKFDLQPCGLINCGNSCYANVVLQCLAFTPPLTAYFLQGSHSKACLNKEWCFTCEFERLIMKAKGGTSPLSPIGILSQIKNIGSHLGHGKQEDAHEFLRYTIDKMQSICLKEGGVNNNTSGFLEETSLIGLTFGGYLRSKIKCMKCGGKSERHERMMDLTVEIEGDIGTLEEALRRFTATEILDGENKYHCSSCKSYEKARKKLTVYEAPNILTIALKRFQSGKFGKLNKSIKFPETLNLAPCMSRTSDKSPVYMLYGVVVHLDIMNTTLSGHYVCYIKNVQNKWFKIDDSTVKAVDRESVLTKGAYMLLYSRCSPRSPRLIRNPTMRTSNEITDGRRSGSNYHPNCTCSQQIHSIQDDDSSSENSLSMFSEERSCSTESSNVDSTTSSDDIFEQFLSDVGCHWNSLWKHSSDSDSSSSSSSPSPLYHHGLRYSSQDADPILYTDKTSRKLGNGSSCCRVTEIDRLGRANEGVLLRRSRKD